MSESRRVLPGYTVQRDDVEQRVTVEGITVDDDGRGWLSLTVDDLRNLLRYAETGEEPAPTPEEAAATEGKRDFAAFLNSLLLDKGKVEGSS